MRSAAPAASRAGCLRLLAAVALFCGSMPAAHAQYTRSEPVPGRFRVGPLRLTPRLTLVNAGRDTNVYNTAQAVPDDSIVVRGAVKAAASVRERLRLSGEGWLDYSRYRRQETETSTDPGGEARAEMDFGPWTLVGGPGAYQARQRYSIEIDQRVLREERYLAGGGEWRLTRQVSFSAGLEGRSYRFDPSTRTAGLLPAALALDRNALTGRLQARYRLSSLTTLVGSADLIEEEYASARRGLRKTRSYRYLGGFEFGERALLAGRVMAGVREIPRSSAGTLPLYRGPAALAELTLPFLRRGRLVGTVQRDVFTSAAVSDAEQRNAYTLTGVRGVLDWDLPLALLARVSGAVEQSRYIRPQSYAGSPFRHAERLESVGVSLLRRLGDSIRVGGTVTYYRRLSTRPGYSFDRWVYGIQAELVP